jgi:hypothetical protein
VILLRARDPRRRETPFSSSRKRRRPRSTRHVAGPRRETAGPVRYRAIRRFQKESDPFLGFAWMGRAPSRCASWAARRPPGRGRHHGGALVPGDFGLLRSPSGRRPAEGEPGLAALFRRIAGSRAEGFIRRTMSFALAYAQQAEEDWRAFVRTVHG